MEVNEQPTAPYLDAVAGYAFRGPARYHVPGHKGGPGADPGVRKTLGVDCLAADVPQDIHGIDLGPSPTPYERAELLAAEAFGAGRTFFLTNGATQGNHTLCLALAPLGTRMAALRDAPDARAAFIVSPTYYGMAADVAACAQVAHDVGVPLVVDQAWGPHFGFHPALPDSALAQG